MILRQWCTYLGIDFDEVLRQIEEEDMKAKEKYTMRKLTFKLEIDNETFQPKHVLYLDELKTNLYYNIEPLMDSFLIHGIDLYEVYREALIAELKEQYNITDEEEKEYKIILEEQINE